MRPGDERGRAPLPFADVRQGRRRLPVADGVGGGPPPAIEKEATVGRTHHAAIARGLAR